MKSSKSPFSFNAKVGLSVLGLVVAVLLIAQPMLPSKSKGNVNQQADSANVSLPVVDVLTAKPHDPFYKIQTVGRLMAKSQIDVVAEVSGKVSALADGLEVGSYVEAGDLLYQINDTIYQANVVEAKARVDIAAIQVRVEEVAFGRNEKLYAEKAISDAQYDISMARLASAKASLDQAKAALAVAEETLDRTKVKAPFKGVVTNRMISVGSFVNPGQKTLSLAGTDQAQIKVTLTRDEAAAVAEVITHQQGAPVPVTAHPNAGTVGTIGLEGVIESLSPEIDSRSRSALLLTVFEDAFKADHQGRVFFGDFLTVDITAKHDGPVWTVPQGVLRKGKYVWLVEDGSLKKAFVTIIGSEGDLAIVSSDINLDQKAIMETLFAEEYDGMKVRLSSSDRQNP